MKNKIKKFYKEHEEGCIVAINTTIIVACVGFLVAKAKNESTPVYIEGRWVDEAKTTMQLRVFQKNGKITYFNQRQP